MYVNSLDRQPDKKQQIIKMASDLPSNIVKNSTEESKGPAAPAENRKNTNAASQQRPSTAASQAAAKAAANKKKKQDKKNKTKES